MKIYRIYQGLTEKNGTERDRYIEDVYTNKAKAMKEFNYLKKRTVGWSGFILTTQLVREDTEDGDIFDIISEHNELIK